MDGANGDLKFGIFDWIDHNAGLNLHETYEQRLRMLELADEAGIWCYHVAEHHGTPLAVAPSPNLFLAAAAERTERLRLGPLVQLLPLNNPLRNIEEVCVLDNLSDGRLELGIGRGVSPEELEIYGLTIDEGRERFQECFDILLQGLRTGRVTYKGKYYNIHDAPVTIEPQQRPYPPLWYPTSSPDRVAWVAKEGFNTLFGFTRTGMDVIAAGVAQYRDRLGRTRPRGGTPQRPRDAAPPRRHAPRVRRRVGRKGGGNRPRCLQRSSTAASSCAPAATAAVSPAAATSRRPWAGAAFSPARRTLFERRYSASWTKAAPTTSSAPSPSATSRPTRCSILYRLFSREVMPAVRAAS